LLAAIPPPSPPPPLKVAALLTNWWPQTDNRRFLYYEEPDVLKRYIVVYDGIKGELAQYAKIYAATFGVNHEAQVVEMWRFYMREHME